MAKWKKDNVNERTCPVCGAECEIKIEEEENWDGRIIKYVKAEKCSKGCYKKEF